MLNKIHSFIDGLEGRVILIITDGLSLLSNQYSLNNYTTAICSILTHIFIKTIQYSVFPATQTSVIFQLWFRLFSSLF